MAEIKESIDEIFFSIVDKYPLLKELQDLEFSENYSHCSLERKFQVLAKFNSNVYKCQIALDSNSLEYQNFFGIYGIRQSLEQLIYNLNTGILKIVNEENTRKVIFEKWKN